MLAWSCWMCGNTWTYKDTWMGRRALRRVCRTHLDGCISRRYRLDAIDAAVLGARTAQIERLLQS